MKDLQQAIEEAFEVRAEITPGSHHPEARMAVDTTLDLLVSGAVRVAEKVKGNWHVNEWLKKAGPDGKKVLDIAAKYASGAKIMLAK